MHRILVGLAAVTTVAACAQAPGADGSTVSLFKSLGGRQCESPGPSPDALVAPLRDAKIELKSMRCGSDGRMRAQVCGAGDGRIVIVEIPAAQQDAARSLGWAPLAVRPDASAGACR